MPSDTAEPSDEALIEARDLARYRYRECASFENREAFHAAHDALLARLASKDRRIAKRDREIGQMEAEINYQIDRANVAEAAFQPQPSADDAAVLEVHEENVRDTEKYLNEAGAVHSYNVSIAAAKVSRAAVLARMAECRGKT